MTRSASTSATLTKRYVTALLDAATEKGAIKDIASGTLTLVAMIDASEDLRTVLASPLISVTNQLRAIGAVLAKAKISPLMIGFVSLVIRNRRGAVLGDFLQATLAELARREGLVDADVEVASPINDIQQRKLTDMISKWSGGKVNLKVKVTPDILGGMKIRVGSIQIDDSVAGKLERLRQNLLGTKASA